MWGDLRCSGVAALCDRRREAAVILKEYLRPKVMLRLLLTWPQENFGMFGAAFPGTFYRRNESLPSEMRISRGNRRGCFVSVARDQPTISLGRPRQARLHRAFIFY